MPKLSKGSEKRITDALEKAADLITQGEHPNEALIKAAADAKVPAGHIQLMVNAINTGRTNVHRLTHDDPLEKAGEFPLADADTVIKALFPDNVQTKVAAYLNKVVADEYYHGPRWTTAKQAREKLARVLDVAVPTATPVPTDPDIPIKKAITTVQRAYMATEDLRLKMAAAREQALKLADELRIYFKQPGHINFDEVKANSELLFGKQACAVLTLVAPAKQRSNTPLTKNAAFTAVDVKSKPYSLVHQTIKLAAEFKTHKTAYEASIKKANQMAVELLGPFVPGPKAGHSVMADLSSLTDSELHKEAFLGTFLARGLGMVAAGDIAKEVARRVPALPTTSKAQEEKDIQSLMDPAHENEIRNIQSEALINDLMANDDVIKGYDPEDVVDAYNEIAQITPYAVDKKVIVRDLLRRRLGGGPQALDQFAVGDALKTQSTLQELSTPKPSNLSVLSSYGVFPHGNGSSGGSSVLA